MEKNAIKLVVCNLQDTLVQEEPMLAAIDRKMINQLHDHGISFTYMINRMPYQVVKYVDGILKNVPIAGANGGYLEWQGKKLLDVSFTPNCIRDTIRKYMDDSLVVLFLFENEERPIAEKTWTRVISYKNPGFDRPLGDDDSVWDQPVYRVKIVDPKKSGVIRKIADELKATACGVSVFQNGLDSIEIFSSEASKEDALQKIASILGFTAEETLVIGSSETDIPGFRWAKQSVAIGNAHYKLKNEATYVADRKYACGVAEGIEHYFPEINVEHHCAIM